MPPLHDGSAIKSLGSEAIKILFLIFVRMILDVARHKFWEGIATLVIIAMVAVVRGATLVNGDASADEATLAPLALWLNRFELSHPILAALLEFVMIIQASLSLARSSVRLKIYPAATMALMSLTSLLITGMGIYHMPLVTVAAMLLGAEAISRFMRCLGHSIRPHYLFTAMLSVGMMPLLDSALMALLLLTPLLLLLVRADLRAIVVAVVGATLPIFSYAYIEWCLGGSFTHSIESLWSAMLAPAAWQAADYFTPMRLAMVGVVLFAVICSLMLYRRERLTLSLGARHVWFFLQAILPLTCVIFMLLPSTGPITIATAMLPAACIMPLFFQKMDSFISITAYVLLIILTFAAL